MLRKTDCWLSILKHHHQLHGENHPSLLVQMSKSGFGNLITSDLFFFFFLNHKVKRIERQKKKNHEDL